MRPGALHEVVSVKQARERAHHLLVVVLGVTASDAGLGGSAGPTSGSGGDITCTRPAPPMRRWASSWAASASGLGVRCSHRAPLA